MKYFERDRATKSIAVQQGTRKRKGLKSSCILFCLSEITWSSSQFLERLSVISFFERNLIWIRLKFKSGGMATLALFRSGRFVKRTIYKFVWIKTREEIKTAAVEREGKSEPELESVYFFWVIMPVSII